MAEFIYVDTQTVGENSNVLFNDSVVDGCDLIYHRNDSGIIKLFPINGKCYTRYKVTFGGNIAVPTGGNIGSISIALSIDGEPITSTVATVTPAAVGEYFNVSTSSYVYVRHGCCSTIGVKNVNSQSIEVANANIIVTRD